jgi:hypothetical protein
MSEANKGFDPIKLIREARDGGMDAWAKLMLRLTSSHEYQRVQGAISKPTLLAVALYRKAAESAMSEVLAQLNMPSREDVLSLSTRLTHIEMAIDDLGAGLEQLRRAVGVARPQRTSSRDRDAGSETRPSSAQEA